MRRRRKRRGNVENNSVEKRKSSRNVKKREAPGCGWKGAAWRGIEAWREWPSEMTNHAIYHIMHCQPSAFLWSSLAEAMWNQWREAPLPLPLPSFCFFILPFLCREAVSTQWRVWAVGGLGGTWVHSQWRMDDNTIYWRSGMSWRSVESDSWL